MERHYFSQVRKRPHGKEDLTEGRDPGGSPTLDSTMDSSTRRMLPPLPLLPSKCFTKGSLQEASISCPA